MTQRAPSFIIKISIVKAKHAYQGIELLYMIDKEAEIRTDVTFTMKENDMIV